MYEVQFHLVRQGIVVAIQGRCAARGELADVLDRLGDLGDVFLDEILGPGEGAVVELRSGDVAEVADEAGAEEVDELLEIALLTGGDEGVESFGDEAPVIVLGRWVIPPASGKRSALWYGHRLISWDKEEHSP